MKKVYVNPMAGVVKFQFEDIITTSGGVTTNATDTTFAAAEDSVGIGSQKVIEFDFGDL